MDGMRNALVGLILAAAATGARADDVKVVNGEARFPEGPVWHDGTLYYTEYGGHTVMTWDGERSSVFWRQDGCGPSAVIPVGAGDFLVTCYDAGTVVRIAADGKTLASYDRDKDGHPFVGPNDFAVDARGGVYFSASGPWESGPIVGKIYYMAPDGSIVAVADDLHYANGLALSDDGRTLYCAESEAYRVIRFTVGEDGSLSDRRLFVRLNALLPDAPPGMYPDGLAMDGEGNLYIAQYTAGQILVVSPEGKLLRTIEVPSPAAPNLAFGPGEAVVYVTAVDDVNNAPWPGKVYAVPNE